MNFKMADKLFKICRKVSSAPLAYKHVLLTRKIGRKNVSAFRYVSRLSVLTRESKKTSLQTDETPIKTRPRIKSLAKEHPPEKEKNDLLCLTFSTSEQYHLIGLRDTMNAMKEDYTISALPKDARDVLHVCTNERDENGMSKGEIFFFRLLGAVVFWNLDKQEIQHIRTIMRRFEGHPRYTKEDIEDESEEIPFSYSKNHTSFIKGRILLCENESIEERALQKFAFSSAIALSVKLGIWESQLEEYIDSLAWVPTVLSKGVKLKMSRQEILEKTGELISLRYKINLYSDLLMTPDFYWDREELGKHYESMCSYMDIRRRTKVMNEKLNHCSELAELLRSHLSERHSNRLEWGIIALIAIEVIFEIIHLVETHMPLS